MKLTLRTVFMFVGLLFVGSAQGSLPAHNELWNRLFVSHEFSKNFRLEGEYQYRLQNIPSSNDFPSNRLQQGIRVWAYQKINEHWTVGLSPFCLFRVYPLINSIVNLPGTNSTELRFSANSEWKANAMFSEFKFRVGYESRHSKKDESENWSRKDRLRIRALLTLPLANIDSSLSKLSVYTGDEYFFQGQDVFTRDVQFDQNRIITGISYKLCSWLKLDAMYMHILKYNSAGDYYERVVWLNTTIYL